LYSNRSAAFLANSEISKALKDAQKCVELDPGFVKGHSRLAAALFALKRYDQAKDVYQRVLESDPNNAAAKQGKAACEKELDRIAKEQQQERDEAFDATRNSQGEETPKADKADEEEDDLLNGFFEEVEEVVTKRKEEVAMAMAPTATNAIRNDRETLGTTESQIERLLQNHYEWRNLNPYYVLQLAATATDEDINRRYKALSLLLHPDKNQAKLTTEKDRDRAQLAFDFVKKAKQVLSDADRKRYVQSLVEEGMKQGEWKWAQEQKKKKNHKNDDASSSLEAIQEREVMKIFAEVEKKRREVEDRERKYEQRERQQEDELLEKERSERKFDKQWRKEERVDKRVGNWRDFSSHKKKKM